MDQNTFSHIQLWCPRPFGTYSQNKQCPGGQVKKTFGDFACKAKEEEGGGGEACSENTPPAPPPPPPPPPTVSPNPTQVEEGRVLLDTWYVIKPGNTKEKVAFFVAHQCSSGSRASAMKVKGNWGSDSSKAKRRRRSHDPGKSKACPVKAKDAGSSSSKEAEDVCLCPESHAEPAAGDSTDLLSVAEMVALVEQRTALALQNYPRPSVPAAPPSPMVFVSAEQEGEEKRAPSPGGGSDWSRVAEAVAHFESQQQRERSVLRPNGLCRESPECVANSQHSPGEVRIAFRISSSRDPRSPTEGSQGARPNCMFMSCGGSPTGSAARAKDKITCDLYQLISPSRDTLPNNVDFLLANASPKGPDGVTSEPPDVEMTCRDSPSGSGKLDAIAEGGRGGGEKAGGPTASVARDCVSGFHVDVVVTGVVDQCVFFGKDSTKNMKEETVCLTVGSPTQEGLCSSCDDPPPGQLFFLHAQVPRQEDGRDMDGAFLDPASGGEGGLERADGSGLEPTSSDTSLCRLYRHVSHDFLEIRFKIQRLLEPRQYMLLLPDHIMVKIFSYLPTQSLAALKCSCHYFKYIIEAFGVQATDSRWTRDPLYRDDPCKQCKKHYEKGDVSLCRWHPKPYHHDLPYGRSYWMCCRRTDKDTPGCRVGLHDNNWVQPCDMLRERGARREDGR
ncbi:F-box only protein 46 [Zootoca vivipara]|uniref:F-box only protein 46 n=1 Tax=Zootoca vivipara TaxID=8524 RepID=UPI00293BB7BB|nr:F-box only protein 46 [Zootoca vivipara]XP_034974983.2 F-box only protein 46 [Zootoca vivipara]XP_034974985.2 F-box only protein 46 [Zootoca vivipara]XP_060131542.1 F-box only protein 46 [Zootoca vivipara]